MWQGYLTSHFFTNLWESNYLVGRVFANSLGNWGSIPVRVIPKTQTWYLIPPCLILSIIGYVSRVKWSNPGKRLAPYPTPRCSSYWKGSRRVALNYSCQLYFTYWIKCIDKRRLSLKKFNVKKSFIINWLHIYWCTMHVFTPPLHHEVNS